MNDRLGKRIEDDGHAEANWLPAPLHAHLRRHLRADNDMAAAYISEHCHSGGAWRGRASNRWRRCDHFDPRSHPAISIVLFTTTLVSHVAVAQQAQGPLARPQPQTF